MSSPGERDARRGVCFPSGRTWAHIPLGLTLEGRGLLPARRAVPGTVRVRWGVGWVLQAPRWPLNKSLPSFLTRLPPKEDPQVRVELDMEPKSEPEGPRERGWGPRPELEKNGGGVLVSCLAQVGKTKIVM